MGGIYRKGETKVRPGIYYRQENGGVDAAATLVSTVAAVFQANWGPIGEPVTLKSAADAFTYFGDDSGEKSNTKIIEDIFSGGASIVKAIRVGGKEGGTCASTKLKDETPDAGKEAVTLTAKYPGTLPLSVSIRDSLAYSDKKECIIYTGTRELTKVLFDKGETGEADALVAAINADSRSVVTAKKEGEGTGDKIAAIVQTAFTTEGKSPTVTNTDYSAAFESLETDSSWDLLCVDTDSNEVHALVKNFLSRANDNGLMATAVIGEPTSIAYSTRLEHVAGFDSQNIVYVLNGFTRGAEAYEGWRAAAVVAGRISGIDNNDSVTHKIIDGATGIVGPLTNSQVEECLTNGALVFTRSRSGAVWIEQGINTLVHLKENQDAGWKKIRRTRTRYELIKRIDLTIEGLVGSITNDSNGRATVIALAQGIINTMVAEGKLLSGSIVEDAENPATGDSAWFVIAVDDLDSLEKIYLTYYFRFSTNSAASAALTAATGGAAAAQG